MLLISVRVGTPPESLCGLRVTRMLFNLRTGGNPSGMFINLRTGGNPSGMLLICVASGSHELLLISATLRCYVLSRPVIFG
jgi:hypothetical protein